MIASMSPEASWSRSQYPVPLDRYSPGSTSTPTSWIPLPLNDTAFGTGAPAAAPMSSASAPGAAACAAIGATAAAAPACSGMPRPPIELAIATDASRPATTPGMAKRFLLNQGGRSPSSGRSRRTRPRAGAPREASRPGSASCLTATPATGFALTSVATPPRVPAAALTPASAELVGPPTATTTFVPGAKSPSHWVPSQYRRGPPLYGYQPGGMVDMVASLGNCASPGMIVGRFPPTIRATPTHPCGFVGNAPRSGRTAHAIVRSADGTTGSAATRSPDCPKSPSPERHLG